MTKASSTVRIIKTFLQWPSKPGSNLAPWPVVARRLLFMPFIVAGIALGYTGKIAAFLGILLAFGPAQAADYWEFGHFIP